MSLTCRIGPQLTERLVGPLLGSLHVGNVHRLNLAATAPQVADVPSGFLPFQVRSVRQTPIEELNRVRTPLLRQPARPAALGGRCGRREFREVCGGSCSRAYAATGDALSEEPICSYAPGSTVSRDRRTSTGIR